MKRRRFVQLAGALGATALWGRRTPLSSQIRWSERRDLFAEGVASGDPQADSVILWTRYALPEPTASAVLHVEVAEDEAFRRVIAEADASAVGALDGTCRALVGGLRPATTYWYRFTDREGRGSRVGRTRTAPDPADDRPVRFAFVSCQNINTGAMNAWRRMLYEDERAAPGEQLDFVLHLGDFIYELVWYPEDRPRGMYDRAIRDILRFPQGEKFADFHIPVTLEDYRTVYRAYLRDPDLQDARARFPFVCIWDNHEFTWVGWQGMQQLGGQRRPAQTRKVAANQAWFEYQPARVAKPSGSALDRFDAPDVEDVPIEPLDEHGLGQDPNNLAAIRSLTAYRALRFGRNVELFITDQHSYRSESPMNHPEARLGVPAFLGLMPEEAVRVLDAGRTWNSGNPPDSIRVGAREVRNFRKDMAPPTILGAEQKTWFLERLAASGAIWKVWGNSLGTLEWRADPQNLPSEHGTWPGAGYALLAAGDYAGAFSERREIYEFVREHGITGFAVVSGDRHSFWAGLAAPALTPDTFDPVGLSFVTGSINSSGTVEAFEHNLQPDLPLRSLFLADRGGAKPAPTINMLLRHGVRACLEYAQSGDAERARALSNPELAPHLSFVDLEGHGYAAVTARSDAFDVEFVCIPRPIETSESPDGGPLRYRVVHHAPSWNAGEHPRLEQRVIEGDPGLAL